MAYKDSDELKTDERYPLGDYSFRIERSSVPGSTNDKIEAICTDKDGKNARKSIQVPSSAKIDGWYVEANENEASVYAAVTIEPEEIDTSPVNQPIVTGTIFSIDHDSAHASGKTWIPWLRDVYSVSGGVMTALTDAHITGEEGSSPVNTQFVFASSNQGAIRTHFSFNYATGGSSTSTRELDGSFTYNGKTVYYTMDDWRARSGPVTSLSGPITQGWLEYTAFDAAKVAWAMVYSHSEEESKEYLVGRFAIDLDDAGGVGPGSDWTDPGDYDEDWEEGDPTHTLYVTVTGALSGRHNDPIEDPSYSYIPADKDTVKDYGCGGDGGHGGGGGAGAATVVIHKFATNQANSKEVVAIARRHGYGSGGGKGGKGGDGCILVYYGSGDSPGPGPEPVIWPIVASLAVNKASAAIDEVITWTLSATGGNGNYQYSFTLLDSNNQQVHSTGWQSGSSFSYSLQTEGTYHVVGYVQDSRETDTAQAPQSGTVQVSGSEPTPTPTPTGNAESQYNIYEISWTGIATSGEGPEPTPTPEGNAQSQYNISELNWSSTVTGGEEPGPEPTPTPQADVLSNYEISDLSWTVEMTDTTPSPSPEPEPAPTPDGIAVAQFDISSLSWNVTFN